MSIHLLTDFLRSLCWEDIPKPIQRRTRLLLLDLLGTGLAGTGTKLHRIVTDYACRHLGSGRARVPFTNRFASPEGAAMAGGMTIDAVDAHDGHRLTKGHVGCAVLPTLLALLDDTEAPMTGEGFLTLLTAGYEIGTRAGIALHATAPDYHTSGAWNAVTCAALAAHILALDGERFAHALGIAEYHGPRSQMMRGVDHPTMVKDGSGWGALAGVSAAYLAQAGFTGAPALTIMDPALSNLWSTLGSTWETANQYIKGFPVCRWAQPAVQAALDLAATHSLSAQDVEEVRIATFHQAVRLFSGVPETTEQAQYAITFPVAAALVRGQVGLPEILPTAFADLEIRRIVERTRLEEDKDLTALFPAERWARVHLRTRSGQEMNAPLTQARGDLETPYGDREIIEKFHQLAGHVADRERLTRIERAVFDLDNGRASLEALQAEIFAVTSPECSDLLPESVPLRE
ncbi:MmgE/PrpD family protein [Rhodospirillum sp. A1_3_36]|uniref:MmgE/PrpD family protein n=1 Tax=Rhodospirillum sp. A1_3_36 TaxID=3391666 RepID=UPI0039A41BCA